MTVSNTLPEHLPRLSLVSPNKLFCPKLTPLVEPMLQSIAQTKRPMCATFPRTYPTYGTLIVVHVCCDVIVFSNQNMTHFKFKYLCSIMHFCAKHFPGFVYFVLWHSRKLNDWIYLFRPRFDTLSLFAECMHCRMGVCVCVCVVCVCVWCVCWEEEHKRELKELWYLVHHMCPDWDKGPLGST